ncbi:putative phage tail protein [Enterococcus sp. DIV1420a]|uniref:putative phage tail protein n=1 Tax=Enterococcus sp. DIV1420a TaxID=2774672 RepID=UPI003F27ADC8
MTLSKYLPDYYEGVREFDCLMQVEDKLMVTVAKKLTQVKMNQWIQTADEQTICYQEALLNILPNPAIESLAFRRERLLIRMQTRPPFTLGYLKEQLNQIFGDERYTLDIDEQHYQLILETAIKNANWFYEVQALIQKIKPANLVYTHLPVLTETIQMKGTASVSTLTFFRLGESRVGRDPLVYRSSDKEVALS